MNKRKIKCPECQKWYEWASMYVGDQSMCPACRGEREVTPNYYSDPDTEPFT